MARLAALPLFGAGRAGGDGEEVAAPSWPGQKSTGERAGTTLTPLNGETRLLATPGEVVDGKDVTGCLTVTASNVTLRRFRNRGCAREPAIRVGYGLTGVVIGDCELDEDWLDANASTVEDDGDTICRADIHGTDTIDAGSATGKPHSAGTSGIRVLGKRFGRPLHADGGLYRPVSGFDPGRPGNVWAGNVWHDSGAPVEP